MDLRLWTHDPGYVSFFTEALPLASSRSPFDYSLSTTQIGASDLVTKLIAQAIADRGLPDIAGFEIGHFARLLRGELTTEMLLPLDDAVSSVRDDLIEARVAPFSKDGHLYALDSDVPLAVYYMRTDLFESLGVPSDIETWEELAEFGAGFHQRTGKALGAVATGTDLNQVMTIFWMLLLQRGGTLFDADGELQIESPEAEDVLTFLVDGVQSGFLTTVSDFYGPSMQTALKRDEVIGLWMASWYEAFGLKPNVPEQEGLWRIRPMPRFADGGTRTAVAGGTGFGVATGTPHTQAAAEFLTTAYLDPEQQVKRFQDFGYLPTRRSVYEDARLFSIEDPYLGGQRSFEVFSELVDEAPPVYLSPDIQILQTVLAGSLVDAYRGRRSPSEALTTAAESFRSQSAR